MIGLVVLAVLCTAGSQYVQALAARRLNRSLADDCVTTQTGGAEPWLAMLKEPRLYLAYALLGLGLLFWLVALTALDVSRAYPLFSLGFVLTLLLARFGLGEEVSARGWCGAVLIVAGSLLCTL